MTPFCTVQAMSFVIEFFRLFSSAQGSHVCGTCPPTLQTTVIPSYYRKRFDLCRCRGAAGTRYSESILLQTAVKIGRPLFNPFLSGPKLFTSLPAGEMYSTVWLGAHLSITRLLGNHPFHGAALNTLTACLWVRVHSKLVAFHHPPLC